MLRAVSSIYIESQALELLTASRRDVFKVFRAATLFSTAPSGQTVLSSEAAGAAPPARAPPPPSPPPPPPPRPSPPRRSWTAATSAAVAVTASIGGIYLFRKYNDNTKDRPLDTKSEKQRREDDEPAPYPATGAALPSHVEYLVVGGGTAAFAALRALRAAQPEARVLVAAAEPCLPYMRPPLSKEIWREPDLGRAARQPDSLAFTQWNGKRRGVLYEPSAFYTPVERLAAGHAGVGVATGWRVARLHVERHEAELRDSTGEQQARVTYDKCLVAPGVRARRAAALWAEGGAGRAGRVLHVRGVRDVQLLARELDVLARPTLALVGGGFLASELGAALASPLKERGGRVIQIFREPAALSHVLPSYLAADASARLEELGVHVLSDSEVLGSRLTPGGRVQLQLAGGAALEVDLVVECVGSEVDDDLARDSQLETHPTLGGLVVNAELQARADVWAAGDAACFHDVVLGRRRVEHHDHAVLSGRRAGNNMAGPHQEPYRHQSMFWSDLGPELGFEAIGIVDSKLPTVAVFSEEAVTSHGAGAMAADTLQARDGVARAEGDAAAVAAGGGEGGAKKYERGVVFYLREKRVVGVLLWNLFNRMHIARQVMAQGEFEDLFEVAKLFAPQEEE